LQAEHFFGCETEKMTYDVDAFDISVVTFNPARPTICVTTV